MTLDRSLTTAKQTQPLTHVRKYLFEVEQEINNLLRVPGVGVGDFIGIITELDRKDQAHRESASFWYLRDILASITRRSYLRPPPDRADPVTCIDFTPELERHFTLLHYAAMFYFAYGPHRLLSESWLNDFRLREDIQRNKVAEQMYGLDLVHHLKHQTPPIRMSQEAIDSLQGFIDLRHSSHQLPKRTWWRRRKSP